MTRTDKQVDLVMVGSVGLDTIATPLAKCRNVLGGSASYACAAAAFFARPGMVGIVGADFPDKYVTLYRDLGIDVEGLQQAPGKTFRWSGVYEDDFINRRTLSTELNVFESFQPELPAGYRATAHVLLGNIAPALQLHVLTQVPRPRLIMADTMDLWINTARADLEQLIARVHVLTLNDSEARQLTGRHNLKDCAARILAMGPRFVVIKKGEHGAMLFSEKGIFLVPAFPVDEVRDPTGAGDTFAGACLGYLARANKDDEHTMREALLYGSVVASYCVEDFSLERLRTLTRAEIETRYRELRRMSRVD